MLALRVSYTAVAMVVVVWLLRSGEPVGGLLIVPALAVWLRRTAESGQLTDLAKRLVKLP
jgi:hypothetical protein